MKPYIDTYSGRKINLLHPDPDDILIEDIAHALSLICRWGGHIRRHYSVGAHSILVAAEVKPTGAKLPALLHDATEAYIQDIVSPLKRQDDMDMYRVIEDRFNRTVMKKFGALEAWDFYEAEIHRADKVMLERERAAFKPHKYLTYSGPAFPAWTMNPREVYDTFLCNFNAYSNTDLFPMEHAVAKYRPGDDRDERVHAQAA